MARVRMSRAGRKDQIRQAMEYSAYRIHTVNSVARLIGLKPSGHLRELLSEMVWDEILVVKSSRYDNGEVSKRWYALATKVSADEDFFMYSFPF